MAMAEAAAGGRPLARDELWRGVRTGLPFVLVVGPFGLLFGVAATEAGLPVAQVMGFSVLVIAGASQFAALGLIQDGANAAVILATALAVNLRMAMYSASLTPHLGAAKLWQRALIAYLMVDQTYAAAISRYEAAPRLPLPAKLAFYAGAVAPVAPGWYAATLAGALAGRAIPPAIPLDFAVPITFIALIAPMLRTAPQALAAGVSVAAALALAGLPYGTGLLLAALAAMIAGAGLEAWLARRGGAR